MDSNEVGLRYGCNPHQKPARVYANKGRLPFKVLNGTPGYINLLDALNSWQLVRELRRALELPAAASFKHVSPAGAAVGIPLNETLKSSYFISDLELSPLASAYARARGADRVSSYGDWAALSDKVDLSTARILRRENSDGVIAPGYDEDALAILSRKRGGKYTVIEIDPYYEPEELETRQVFGISFEQKRNDALTDYNTLKNIVTANKDLPDSAKRDLVVAQIALKYTQSNSICLAQGGQVIGAGAGQQSRIHCTRLAASKADGWYLRQHPRVLDLKFRDRLSRPEVNNAIDGYLRDDLTSAEETFWQESFEEAPQRLTAEEKKEWLGGLKGVALGSDALITFRDNIDRAAASGVKYIAQPGNSIRDEDIIKACDEYGMVMVFSGVRLFHH